MRFFKCVAGLLAAWGNASICSPASLVWVQAHKADVYLEVPELQPTRQASENCSKFMLSGWVKARFERSPHSLKKLKWSLGRWQIFINARAVSNFNNASDCLQITLSSPTSTNCSNHSIQEGSYYFISLKWKSVSFLVRVYPPLFFVSWACILSLLAR